MCCASTGGKRRRESSEPMPPVDARSGATAKTTRVLASAARGTLGAHHMLRFHFPLAVPPVTPPPVCARDERVPAHRRVGGSAGCGAAQLGSNTAATRFLPSSDRHGTVLPEPQGFARRQDDRAGRVPRAVLVRRGSVRGQPPRLPARARGGIPCIRYADVGGRFPSGRRGFQRFRRRQVEAK